MFEFKQNLPGQLNALLIHMFDGDNISLMVGMKGEKKKLVSEVSGYLEYRRTAGASRSSAGHKEEGYEGQRFTGRGDIWG